MPRNREDVLLALAMIVHADVSHDGLPLMGKASEQLQVAKWFDLAEMIVDEADKRYPKTDDA